MRRGQCVWNNDNCGPKVNDKWNLGNSEFVTNVEGAFFSKTWTILCCLWEHFWWTRHHNEITLYTSVWARWEGLIGRHRAKQWERTQFENAPFIIYGVGNDGGVVMVGPSLEHDEEDICTYEWIRIRGAMQDSLSYLVFTREKNTRNKSNYGRTGILENWTKMGLDLFEFAQCSPPKICSSKLSIVWDSIDYYHGISRHDWETNWITSLPCHVGM